MKLIYLLFFLFTFSVNVFADSNIKREIDINSDSFFMEIANSTLVFKKNVSIKLKNISAKCDKAIIELDSKTGKALKVVMEGNVTISKNDSYFQGNKVIFFPSENKILIEGQVKSKIKFK